MQARPFNSMNGIFQQMGGEKSTSPASAAIGAADAGEALTEIMLVLFELLFDH